ncbi:acyl-CoA dehydrogenase [Marinobacter sp. SS21]|uniref:acyl-CoA dehydrogenase n=1 Tax=Marinobacter sp. SS21 TaxID=2979460 RepID=UPI00232FE97E|nr:acyl-CoA dehydrogenase [Marinobacter sp. SS21]MDC0662978.1 acyl-CoA dehydrogenase [Marinobacter sp. SS21]
MDQLILDTAERILADHGGPERVNQAEDGCYPVELWRAIEEAGLPLAWIGEDAGGVGGSLELGLALIRQSARFALPLPLAEVMLANWLWVRATGQAPETLTGFALVSPEAVQLRAGRLYGTLAAVAFADRLPQLVLPVETDHGLQLAVVATVDCSLGNQRSLAGEARNEVTLNGVEPVALAGASELELDDIQALTALVRAHQIAGALERMVALTVTYVQERQQFGRALAKFQAIQHMVAEMAGESALANAAVEQAARVMADPSAEPSARLVAVATAKSVTSEAAGKVTQLAHQAHGAMGFSHEYPLQQYSRRVWCWRDESGSEFYWNCRLGHHVVTQLRDASDGERSAWSSIAQGF